ncbi:SGNH/GDSL hydrolase family protein [Blastococcus sp. TF02-8]|uniref:SGNH/GDSL hydrolase family protein n=1 Tax=Blastococcus sp. TF02-8 TaxID=2250574 RepID=UPI0014128C9D|nr:SGNH/GDSL hydrolase family protein [Blastococcus sp. TF02-8]
MLQGFERPPWWAVALMAVCTAFLAVALPIAIERGRVPPEEVAASRTAAGSTGSSESADPSAPATPSGAEEQDARLRVAALGDAYTGGSAMDSGAGHRWYELLAAQHPWEVTPYAVGGTGFVTGAAQGQAFPDRVPEIVAARPDVVVVAGGHDDVAAPVDQVEAAVRRTLGDLRAGLPDARIVVGVFWPGRAPGPAFAVDRALRAASGEVGAAFVDPLNDGWFDGANQSLIGRDGTYPTDEGHAALAQRIGDALVAAGVPAG